MTGNLRLRLLHHIGDAPVCQKLHMSVINAPFKTRFRDHSLRAQGNAGETTSGTLGNRPRVARMKYAGIECVFDDGYGAIPGTKAPKHSEIMVDGAARNTGGNNLRMGPALANGTQGQG